MRPYTHYLDIRLPFKPPLYWPMLLSFFRTRAIEGVEKVSETTYTRTIAFGPVRAILQIQCQNESKDLKIHVQSDGKIDKNTLTHRLRCMFDLDTDLATITMHLSRDPLLAPLIVKRPGLRIPGYWEPFETALRAIAGQHVSRIAARHLNTRITERAGSTISESNDFGLSREFPTPEQILKADLSNIGMPGARTRTLHAITEAFMAEPKLFERGANIEDTIVRLSAIKGIGPWTANYIAIRACHEPDGFPASDAGLMRGTTRMLGRRLTPKDLITRAELWRPFRAYAAQHIWTEDDEIENS